MDWGPVVTVLGTIVTAVCGVLIGRQQTRVAAAKVAAEAAAAAEASKVAAAKAAADAADATADNDAALRRDLFRELKRIKADRDELAARYERDMAALQARLTERDEALRQLNRQVVSLGQQMMQMRGQVQGLQDREYIHLQYLSELDKQGNLIAPYEWAQIKHAADRIVPRPVWPALDAIDAAPPDTERDPDAPT